MLGPLLSLFFHENVKALRFDASIENEQIYMLKKEHTPPIQHNPVEYNDYSSQRTKSVVPTSKLQNKRACPKLIDIADRKSVV